MVDALVSGEREVPGLDEEVVVGWGEVDVARLDRRLVVRIADRQVRAAPEEAGEAAVDRVVRAVLRDDDRRIGLGGECRQDLPHCVESSPGSADHNQVVVHAVFFQSFSTPSSSS